MCNSTFCSNPTHLRRKKGYPGIHKNQPLGNRINNNNNNKICLIIKHNHPQWNWNERKNHNSTMLTMWNRVRLGTGNSVSFRGKFWQRCMMSQWRLKWLCYGIERETQNNKKNVENKSRSEVKHTLKNELEWNQKGHDDTACLMHGNIILYKQLMQNKMTTASLTQRIFQFWLVVNRKLAMVFDLVLSMNVCRINTEDCTHY